MADDDDGIGEVGEIVFEPEDGIEVEVVGRLVEEEVVGVAEECLREKDFDLLLTGEVLHELVVEVFLDAETAEEVGGVAFCRPSAHLAELFLELCYLVAVGVGEVGLGVELVFALHVVPQLFMADEDGVEDGVLVEGEVVLDQYGESFAWCHFDEALGGVELSGEDFEES